MVEGASMDDAVSDGVDGILLSKRGDCFSQLFLIVGGVEIVFPLQMGFSKQAGVSVAIKLVEESLEAARSAIENQNI